MNNLEREYRERLFAYFRQYSQPAKQALRQILSSNFQDDVVFIDFSMFPYDCLGNPLPIYTWPFTLDSGVYSDFDCPLSKIPTQEFEYYDEDIEDFVEIDWQLKDCAAKWLRGIWKEAGGEFFRLPCFFTEHDDLESYSFASETWVENRPEIKQKG